ncbi:MAG TPA: PIG-L family deacetylase [Thermoanaerobaculia bacterium]
MERIFGIALVCLISAGAAEARQAIVRREAFDARSILWIAAHPDDETLIAPLLGRLCVEGTSQCSLLVATRGENGGCALPGGCVDLGAIREQEMRAAAAAFRAAITQWRLPDVMSDVAATWSAEATIAAIAGFIASAQPTVIVTFDPNHGSTCHPAHRAIGAMVIEAARRLGGVAPAVFVVETRAIPAGSGFEFENAMKQSIAVDARATWHYLVDDATIHASQFTPDNVAALASTPEGQRVVFIASATAIMGADYLAPCE